MAVPSRYIVVALAVSVLSSVTFVPTPVGAESPDRDRWTYTVEFEMLGVTVSGTLTLSHTGEGTVSVGGGDILVDIYRVEGDFGGQATTLGLEHVVTGACEGYRYEVPGTPSIVREDTWTFANLSVGLDDLYLASHLDVSESVTYTPPLMSGFDPDGAATDDSWAEVVNRTTVGTYDDGLQTTETNESEEVEYGFTIGSTGHSLLTDAGEFDTVEVVVDYGTSREALWYSPEVDAFVRTERFSDASEDPYYVAELTSHSGGSEDDGLVVLAVLSVVLATLVLGVVSALALVRRGGTGT